MKVKVPIYGAPSKCVEVDTDPPGKAVLGVNVYYRFPDGTLVLVNPDDLLNGTLQQNKPAVQPNAAAPPAPPSSSAPVNKPAALTTPQTRAGYRVVAQKTTTPQRSTATFARPIGPAGGDLAGTYPSPTVVKWNGVPLGSVTATAGNVMIGSGTQWVSQPLSGDVTMTSAGVTTVSKATQLRTARNIDGQPFDGTADINVIAPGTHAATSKTTPVGADEFPIADSAASYALKKVTFANLQAALGSGSTFASYTVLTASGGEDQINLSNTPISGSLMIYKNGHLLTGWTLSSTTIPITPLAAGDIIAVDYLASSSTSASTLSTVNDIYFSFVGSRLTFDGTNGSTTFTDNTGKTWTAVNGAQLDTSIKQFGTASLKVTGGSDAITTPHHADFNFGPVDFTIEFWLYPQLLNSTSYFFSNIPNAWGGGGLPTGTNLSWVVWSNTTVGEGDSKLCFSVAVGSTTYKLQDSVTISSLGTGWVKYAMVRDGATLRLYRGIAGTLTQVASTAIAGAINDNNDQVFVAGGNFAGGSVIGNHSACSHMDDIRINKGVCYYPGGTSVAVESAALPTSGNGVPSPVATSYLPFVAAANNATLGRNTANLVDGGSVTALTLPHTGLVDGDMVTFINEGAGAPNYTITSAGPSIVTRAGSDTVINCDIACMQFTAVWKYPNWTLNL